MIIDDEVALKEWLVATLEPLCDAEPIALARYVLALVAKDKPLDKLRENCIDRLDVFLDRATKDFVDQLFEVIRNGRYIPEAKKENVQPKASEGGDDKSGESSEVLEAQASASPSREEAEQQEEEQHQIPSTSQATPITYEPIPTTTSQQSSGTIIQPVKRRYPYRSSSGRHHSPNPRRHINSSSGGANRHQGPSHYRPTNNSNNQRSHRSSSRSRSESPPPAKRTQRSYSHSSTGSSSRSSPSRQPSSTVHPPATTNTNFLYKKIPCSDFFENKGYCAMGDACPYDHGNNALVFDQQHQQNYYPPYQQYGMPPNHLHPHYHEYNPEAPDLKRGPHQVPPMYMRHPMHHHPRMAGPPLGAGPGPTGQQQMMMNPQRTLVTVVTNAEPLPLEQKMRQNDPMGMPNNSLPPVMHTKRHMTAGSYPNDRRSQQHEHSSNNDSNNHNNNAPQQQQHHSNNNNNGYNNRGWKRPWQKPDGSAPATLEIRKIPVEFNTISKLNEHFSKFGTVTNVQIAYDGSPDSALVAYATFHEAETAYKNPQPLFNNRFIKIFWHNSNKGQSSGNNNNNANNNSSQATSQQQPQSSSSDAPPAKKLSTGAPNPMKLHWMKMQQLSGNKSDPPTTTPTVPANPSAPAPVVVPPPAKKPTHPPSNIAKKDAAKKAASEINRKKQDLLQDQIQQQKLLLKKLESAENNTEKESIRSLMKQVDATIVMLKDSLRLTPAVKPTAAAVPTSKPAVTPKISQQDVLKQRAKTLQKQIENLRAKTSADMRRVMSSTLGKSTLNLPNENETSTKDPSHITVKNIGNLPRNELDEFLKKSGATNIQSGDIDHSLIVTYPSQLEIDQIQKNGLKFQDRNLDISFHDERSSNTNKKKRTLSETLEDELLTSTSQDEETENKQRNSSEISDNDENDDVNDDEDRLLADQESKRTHSSIDNHEEFEPTDLDDEIQLLES